MRRALACVLAGILVLVLVPSGLSQDEAPQERRLGVQLEDDGCPAGPGRFCVNPASVQAHEGETLVLEVTNTGEVRHNLTAPNGTPDPVAKHLSMPPLAPNETATVRLPWSDLQAAREQTGRINLTLACGFDGHAALGETLVITVGEPEPERPQPAPGIVAVVASLGLVAWIRRRR